MDDNTVIMTVINEAWTAPDSLLDLFLESFHTGDRIEHLLKHLIIVAMDPKAFDRCKSVHNICYFLKVEGVNFTAEQLFMKKDYLKMMWRRNEFQQSILQMGYNFLFTDVDIIWFRDPFLEISVAAHITISSDIFYGDPNDLGNRANGGFLYAKSSSKTIEFFDNWYLAREKYPGKNEQDIFDYIKHEFSTKFDLKIRFLDTAYIGGFCDAKKDFSKLCTFHANCRVGLKSKLHDLREIFEEWKKYKAQLDDKSLSKNSTNAS
ncbi:uncharacterized protein At4g15970-like [Typha angustifolia]|uniref:uncharacterized protein At4g15970-like n=1 Tax=Typha angustifolia TaxID=59011 RepID=UPI003C2BF298